MDKCREEFEAWIIKLNVTRRVPNFIIKNDNGAYVDPQTADLWIAWKASRESMKAIELPDQADYFSSEYDNDGNEILGFDIDCYSSDVIDAITSAGYKAEE